jgi:pimeloyl-ACP methyl ester carboxylesterase
MGIANVTLTVRRRWHTATMKARMRVHEEGSGEPLLVLLHGLGATGDVWASWAPLLVRTWPGPWIAPDLPGHGGSEPLRAYTFEGLAAAVASVIPRGDRIVVLGHSLGGVVGLTLAGGRLPVQVHAVVGLGIKAVWTDEDLARAQAVAHRPQAWFASRDEAAARYLRVSGLAGLLPADDPAVDAGLREQDGQWQLALDPGAFTVGAPDMAQLLAQARARVTLARGEHDPMNTDEQYAMLGVPILTLPGLGHNAHVEDPEMSMSLLDALR